MSEATAEMALRWIGGWPEGLVGIDKDGLISFVSPKAESLLGWRQSDLEGRSPHDALCVTTRAYAHAQEACNLCCLQPGSGSVKTDVWQTASGHNLSVDYRQLVMDVSGPVTYFLCFQSNRDLEHSQAEMERFALYVEKNPDPIAEFDYEGQMVFANAAMQTQLLERGFNEYGEPLIFPAGIGAICEKSIATGEIREDVVVEIEGRWFRWHFSPVKQGEHTSVLGYATDITAEKLMERQIEEEKAGARRDFFAKMVHELRTPLNAIIGFSQVLIRRADGVLGDREFGHLKSIRAAGLQLNEMISDTLDISKIDAGKMSTEIEAFSVRRVLESFYDQVQTLAEAKGLTYLCLCDESLTIQSDLRKVRQIILNLVSNAIKYTREGHVQVSVEEESGGAFESVIIEVSDTGIGIPDRDIDSLFNAYQRISEEKNKGIMGTGLGLALVAELVEMLHGQITVDSTVNQGSVFTLRLPRIHPNNRVNSPI